MWSTASSHSTWDVPSTSRASTGANAGPGGAGRSSAQPGFDPAPLGLQAPDPHAEDRWARVGPPRSSEALGPGRPALGPVRLAVGPGHQHAPLEAHLVLAGRTPGTGRGRSPRRGRRRPRFSPSRNGPPPCSERNVAAISCRSRSWAALLGLLEQLGERLVPRREPPGRPEPLKVVQRVAPDADEAAAGEVGVHRAAPDGDGQAVRGLGRPRERLGREARRCPG